MGQALSKSEIAEISHGVKRRVGEEITRGEQNGSDAAIAFVVGHTLISRLVHLHLHVHLQVYRSTSR
jgi:hypothetical protein